VWDGDKEVLLHLAKPNPIWDALAERPSALLSVFGAYTYIPGHWNQDEYGVPTSYYAAVQLACDVEVVDDPARTVTDVRAKRKFGSNRTVEHREAVAEQLRERGGALDLEARGHVLERIRRGQRA
jgi:transcriptional regulator